MKVKDMNENRITQAIAAFKKDRTKENLVAVLYILRDSNVWVPCNAIWGQSDQEQIHKMFEEDQDNIEPMVGRTFTSKEQVRLVPDILQNANGYFFPVFSSQEEMGEYGKHFSQVESDFLRAVNMARNNDRELVGIVVNAFSDPMVLPWDLLNIIENHSSRN